MPSSSTYFRQIANRILHICARSVFGATSVRPMLHRLRGVKIGQNVFIGDDVYLENEHPEAVEIHDNVQVSVRAIILAHTRGRGRVVIEKDVFIGPNAVIVTSGNRTLRIGEGAVIGAGAVVTRDVPARTLVASEPAKPMARVRVPFTHAETMEEFVRGLVPLVQRSKSGNAAADPPRTKAR